MEPSGRPTKRPRLKGPDGFHVSKTSSKFTYKPPPNFVSSFDAPKPSTNDPNNKRENPRNMIAHRIRSRRECLQIPPISEFPDFGDASFGHEATSKGKGKSSLVCLADYHGQPEPPASANYAEAERLHMTSVNRCSSKLAPAHPPALLRQKPYSAPLRPLKPPSFVVSAPVNASPSTKPLSFSILKPPPLPQSSTKAVILRPLAPPAIAPTFLKKSSTNMKAISSFATDPTKDGAGAELLSLFLQQNGHSFVPPFECEMQRGIGLSPRKNKGDKGKFKRGGLAERAQHMISCSKINYTLWHRQLEQTLSSAPLTAPLPSHDMLFRILQVLPLPTKTSTPTRAHLALCRIASWHKLARGGELTDQCYVVLFPLPTGGLSRNFDEGKDVLAWKPWFKVLITNVVPKETLETISVEPLMPPKSVIMVPRWHIMQVS